MADYKIEIEGLEEMRKAFKKAPERIGPILEKATKKAGALIVRTEKEEAPAKTANLRRSIELEYTPIAVRITPTANYAEFVHNGTGIFGEKGQMIRPKKAKAMVFQGKGGLVFTKKTKGQPANPFVERTRNKTKDDIQKIFSEAQQEIIDKI